MVFIETPVQVRPPLENDHDYASVRYLTPFLEQGAIGTTESDPTYSKVQCLVERIHEAVRCGPLERGIRTVEPLSTETTPLSRDDSSSVVSFQIGSKTRDVLIKPRRFTTNTPQKAQGGAIQTRYAQPETTSKSLRVLVTMSRCKDAGYTLLEMCPLWIIWPQEIFEHFFFEWGDCDVRTDCF